MAADLGLLAFLFGAASGVVGNAGYALAKRTAGLLPIRGDARKEAIGGEWRGSFTHHDPAGRDSKYDLHMKLKTRRKSISGTGHYVDEGTQVDLVFSGGFHQDSLILLQYKNANAAAVQHGLIILRLANNPNKLTGGFLGIGVSSEAFVSGAIELGK